MGSVEVYGYKRQEWVPYVPDNDKWYQHFKDLRDGYVKPDHRGRYIVGSGALQRRMKDQAQRPVVRLVTPVAQAVEMAKSEVKREKGRKKAKTLPALRQRRKKAKRVYPKPQRRKKGTGTKNEKIVGKGKPSRKRKRRSQTSYHATPKRQKRVLYDPEDQLTL